MIERVESMSKKKKKDHAYPGIDKLIIISAIKTMMKAMLSPSMMLSEEVSTKIILKSSMNREATVKMVIKTWKPRLKISAICLLLDYFLKFTDLEGTFLSVKLAKKCIDDLICNCL